MAKTILYTTTGTNGGQPKTNKTGRVEIVDGDFYIDVDYYKGQGDSYKEREEVEIKIQIGEKVFKGTKKELEKLLF